MMLAEGIRVGGYLIRSAVLLVLVGVMLLNFNKTMVSCFFFIILSNYISLVRSLTHAHTNHFFASYYLSCPLFDHHAHINNKPDQLPIRSSLRNDNDSDPLVNRKLSLSDYDDPKIVVNKDQLSLDNLSDKWSCVYDPKDTADCDAMMTERLPPPTKFQLPGGNEIVGRRRWLFFGDSTMNKLYHDSSLGKILDPNSNEHGNYCPITDVQCSTRNEESQFCGLYDAFDFEKREKWVPPDFANLVGPNGYGKHNPFCKACGSCRTKYHECSRISDVQEVMGTDFVSSATDAGCNNGRQVYGGYFSHDFARDVELQTPEFLYTQENYAAFIDRNWNTQDLLQDWGKPICVIRNGMHDVGFLKIPIEDFHVKYMNNVEWMLKQYLPVCNHVILLGNTANGNENDTDLYPIKYAQTMANMKQMDVNVKTVIQNLPIELKMMTSFIDVHESSLFSPHADFVHMREPWVPDLGSWLASNL
jgi:hypothetical protein